MNEEEKAIANGWTPKDQFKGKEEDFVSAREFNTRGDMIGQIQASKKEVSKVNRQLAEMKGTLSELSALQRKTAERVRAETIQELKEAKKLAIKEGDGEAVIEIDDQLDEIKNDDIKAKAGADEPHINPEIEAFRSEHGYLEDDPVLGGAFFGAAQALQADNPDASPKEIMESALEQVKEQLPHFFDDDQDEQEVTPPKRKASKTLDVSTRKPAKRTKKGGPTAADLDEMQLEFGRKFVQNGAFDDLDAYAAELAANGDL
jgi:hypothetical protein